MKILRITSLILSLTLILTCLSGCHGSKGGARDNVSYPAVFDTETEYSISFWAKNDTNKTQTDIYKKAIADFEALYPNIHISLRLYTDYKTIYSDVITNIQTGTTPNVCITYPDHIATYLTGENVVASLENLIENPSYGLGGSDLRFDGVTQSEIVPEFYEEGKIDGVLYALPYMRSTEACYVNKTYVEKLGYTLPDVLTWDFIFEVSEAAVKKDENGNYKINGQKVMIPFIYKSTDNMMIQWLYQNDVGYSTDDGEILLFNDDTEEFLYEIASHAKTGAFSTFKIKGYPANFLNAGQCIFAVDSTAGSTWMGADAPLLDIPEENIVSFETAVMTVPQTNPDNISMISQGPSVCLFQKEDPGEVVASFLFMQYLLSDDVQMAYAETEGYVPVTLSAQENPAYIDYLSRSGEDNKLHYDVKIAATQLLIDNTKNTFVTPVFNGSASLREAAGHLIEDVTKSVNRKITVDKSHIAALYKDAVSLYRLDQFTPNTSQSRIEALGILPTEAAVFLAALGVSWVLLGIYAVYIRLKEKRKAKKS